MSITTRPATLTDKQAESMLNRGRGAREVLVDSVVVGQYARNKYGVTIGHFDRDALTADENPFVAARLDFSVYPTYRGRRTVRDVIADIAAGGSSRVRREEMAAHWSDR